MPEDKKPLEAADLFIGGEDDDLSGMEYIQDENSTMKVETQPPETKEEAEMIAEVNAAEQEKEDAETDSKDGEEEPTSTDEEGEESEPEEAEASEGEEEGEEEKPVLDEPKIPKDRFDEVNDRMKKAESKVEDLQSQLETVVEEKDEPELDPYDYKAKEKEAMDALLEGDSDKYSDINEEIRAAEKADYLREAKKLAAQGDRHLQEMLTFEEAGAKVEAEFPQFVEGNEGYNQDAREEMLDLYVGYAQSGRYSRVQALQRASAKAAKMYDLVATSVEVEGVPDNVVDIKKPDVKKKAAVDNAQPPTMESNSENREEPKIDFKSMSDEEFDALPESTKMRARGDIM